MQPEASETITLLYIGKAHILRDGPSYSNVAYTYWIPMRVWFLLNTNTIYVQIHLLIERNVEVWWERTTSSKLLNTNTIYVRLHLLTLQINLSHQTLTPNSLHSMQMPLTKIGFYSSSAGHNFDRMYGLFLCRGNTSPELCQSCIKTTSEDIMNRCLNNKKEIIWHVREEKIPLVHTIPDLLLAKAHPLYLRFYDLTEIQPS